MLRSYTRGTYAWGWGVLRLKTRDPVNTSGRKPVLGTKVKAWSGRIMASRASKRSKEEEGEEDEKKTMLMQTATGVEFGEQR